MRSNIFFALKWGREYSVAMFKFCLWVAILVGLLQGLVGEEIPVMQGGRVRPFSLTGEEFSEDLLALPGRFKTDWHPLSDLESYPTYNFTSFSNETFFALVDAWQQKDYEKVRALLAQEAPQKGLQAEILYFSYPWKIFCITLYTFAAICFLFNWRLSGTYTFLTAFFFHTFMLALRCFILSRPPVSNMQETVIYVPWIASLLSLFWVIKYKEALPGLLGALLSLCLLLAPLSDGLENLQPVLNSHLWLVVHVMMIVASYGVLILGGLFAHMYLFTHSEKAFNFILPSMYIGVALLIPGTILGGVWAAESWGRFWDWDPKESWAFISAAVYLVFIHAWRYGKIGRVGLASGAIIGLMAISFTWYGVNYILGTGLHSYGFGNGGEIYYWCFLVLETLIISSALIVNGLKNNSSYDKNSIK